MDLRPSFSIKCCAGVGCIVLHSIQQPLNVFRKLLTVFGKLNRNIIEDLIDLGEHKRYEIGRFTAYMALGNCVIVVFLKFFNLALDGNMLRYLCDAIQ